MSGGRQRAERTPRLLFWELGLKMRVKFGQQRRLVQQDPENRARSEVTLETASVARMRTNGRKLAEPRDPRTEAGARGRGRAVGRDGGALAPGGAGM